MWQRRAEVQVWQRVAEVQLKERVFEVQLYDRGWLKFRSSNCCGSSSLAEAGSSVGWQEYAGTVKQTAIAGQKSRVL